MKSFRGGVHPLKHGGKLSTRYEAIREFEPSSVIIPMSMQMGPPCIPCVAKGDRVLKGQLIGEPQGFLGVPIHSSVSGTVLSVEEHQLSGCAPVLCVEIQNDYTNEWVGLQGLSESKIDNTQKFIEALKNAGIVGMGGAAFPTHVKFCVPEGKCCDTILVNGIECETHLTCDHRIMVEQPALVVDGLYLSMRALKAKKGIICIEDNKPEAIREIKKAIENFEGISLLVLKTKYPQGCEKQLIQAATGKEVPSRGLPIDVGVIVINASTSHAISNAIRKGLPLISRVTTVTGKVNRPSNLSVPIGTILYDLIGACDGYSEDPKKILLGGCMTSPCAPNEDIVILKATGGIVVLGKAEAKLFDESACIRCGRCVTVCPAGLLPYAMKYDCDNNDMKAATAHN
ncbi:MAG: electron transport complex subunit RsxC, partial [Clostridiales bacterium]|nr:electron transport complex subunit RsxC [Clostridiales bacterium]